MTAPFTAERITFAFQPIVDTIDGCAPFAFEALLRGTNGETAEMLLSAVPARETIAFDALCRERALALATSYGIRTRLSLNVSAEAICDRRYGLHATLRAARRAGLGAERLIFEMTEQGRVPDAAKLGRWIAAARNRGVIVALDDFGAGYATINSLLQLRPQMIKLDMHLIRGIEADRSRGAIVRGVVEACRALDCLVVAEGVETLHEFETLRDLGIRLMQGYLFARPTLGALVPTRLTVPIDPGRPGMILQRAEMA